MTATAKVYFLLAVNLVAAIVPTCPIQKKDDQKLRTVKAINSTMHNRNKCLYTKFDCNVNFVQNNSFFLTITIFLKNIKNYLVHLKTEVFVIGVGQKMSL